MNTDDVKQCCGTKPFLLLCNTEPMKKIFLFPIIFTLSTQCGISQHILGLKTGLNLSNQLKTFSTTISPSASKQETKPFWGYQFGAFYKKYLNKKWVISAETNFSLIGSKTLYLTEQQIINPDGVPHYYNDKTGYIEVPVSLQYHFNNLYFGAGPTIAFNVFSKITNFENRTYKNPNYRMLDVATNFLAGYKISKKMDINLRYNYGLINVHKSLDFPEVKNRFINLSLLYSLFPCPQKL